MNQSRKPLCLLYSGLVFGWLLMSLTAHAQSNLIKSNSGEYLTLKQCSSGEKADPDAVCYSETEDLSSYTFVICKEKKSGAKKDVTCSPVFWSEDNEAFQVQFSDDSVGEKSALVSDLQDMKSKVDRSTTTRNVVAGSMLGAAGVLEVVYLARRKVMSNAGVLQVIASALALTAGGYYLIASFVPESIKSFFGMNNSLGSKFKNDDGTTSKGHALSKNDKKFIMSSSTLFEEESDKPKTYNVGGMPMKSIVDVMARALKHSGAADEEKLAKTCFNVGTEESPVLKCYEPGGGTVIIDTLGKDAIKPKFVGSFRAHAEDGSGTVDQNEDNMTFLGLDYKALLKHPSLEYCPYADSLSPYPEDGKLFVAEAQFKCMTDGGTSEACAEKYNCAYQPSGYTSCTILAETLINIQDQLGYNMDYASSKDMCDIVSYNESLAESNLMGSSSEPPSAGALTSSGKSGK